MAEIVNLRRARKARVRSDKERIAAENRAAFGRSKADKVLTDTERRRAEAGLDGARRETGEPDGTP
jgi:hypothetical protein